MKNIKSNIINNFLFTSAFFLLSQISFSQSIYPNIDFENGNFSGWHASTGSCCPIQTPVNGFVPSRFMITSGNATDPYTLGLVPVVAPGGGTYSVRLGNDSVNAEAEKLSFTFTVLPDAPLFIYRYAVIFQFPPDHPKIKQPRFEISVRDQNNNLIDCGFYQVACANEIPGFIENGEYRFKNWTDVGVDLTDYIGQQITMEFATGDCSLGGHFGYAYLDGYAAELKIKSSNCNPDGSITLTAPPGFNYEWSTGEGARQIILNNPVGGSEIYVTLSAVTGCSKTISYVIPDFVPKPGFSFEINCANEVSFHDESTVENTTILNWHWDFGDGFFSSDQNPVHQFTAQNSYPVVLAVIADNNCKSAVTIPVDVKSPVKADFIFDDGLCEGTPVSFNDVSQTSNGTIVHWFWNFDDHAFSDFQNPEHTFFDAGFYDVHLLVTTDKGCADSVSKIISIRDKEACETDSEFSLFIPSAFSPNGDGVNDLFIPSGKNFSEMQIEIFNRWGENVFKNYGNNICWNGRKSDHTFSNDGIYAYKIVAKDISGITHYFSGNLLLLR